MSVVLSGMSLSRKLDRVREVIGSLGARLEGLESEASKEYVRTEDFEELLEKTLRQAAEERSEEKRRIYALFLAGAVESPGEPYDEQLRILRTLEELQSDHLRFLKALSQPPEGGDGLMGSPGQTLGARLPDMQPDRMADMAVQLKDLRLTSLSSLNTMMTFRGAQDLRGTITPYGKRFAEFLADADAAT